MPAFGGSESGEQSHDNSRTDFGAAAPRPFWTLCTCGIFVAALFLLAAALVGYVLHSFYTRIAMPEPLPFERVAYDLGEAARLCERVAAGEEVTLTAQELSALVQSQYDADPNSAGSKFASEFSGDGTLRMQMSLRSPDSAPFPIAGRYFNLDVTCSGEIKGGDAAGLRLHRFHFGDWYRYDDASAEESADILRSMQNWKSKSPSAQLIFDRLQLFRIGGDRIALRLKN
ncbi:MAG: hypothetical protein L0Z55_12860 [Planctomycetes bacterium]|nr:hypothetical protein [Planctomycetota bacterium]